MTDPNVERATPLSNILEGADSDILRSLLLKMLELVMDAEVDGRCGAGYGARDTSRVNQRNGYRERKLETRLGTLELQIPNFRQAS